MIDFHVYALAFAACFLVWWLTFIPWGYDLRTGPKWHAVVVVLSSIGTVVFLTLTLVTKFS